MRRVLGIGDLALVVAVVLVVVDSGGIAFADLAQADGIVVHLASCLAVVAALVRCGQVPALGWLPRTLVAPTPVSALLHAGLVNAGGVILIRFGPLVARSTVATAVGIVAATASMVLGAAIMRGRSEVKTALVWSTTAQMGFMIVQVLVGLGAAAAAHLIAHGAYKSNLFLTSGSALERPAPSTSVRTPAHRAVAAVLTAAVTWLAVWVAGYDGDAHGGAAWLLVGFVALTVFALVDAPSGVARRASIRSVVALVAVAAAVTVYLELIVRFEHWLALPLPAPDGAVGWVVAVIAAVVAAAGMTGVRGGSLPASNVIHARLIAVARRPALDTLTEDCL
jgi:NADH:ubiquinone oxidoreductase subunit 5 (subunit L)/multisubunit Na+/H+ antiporter MnhA subunit